METENKNKFKSEIMCEHCKETTYEVKIVTWDWTTLQCPFCSHTLRKEFR